MTSDDDDDGGWTRTGDDKLKVSSGHGGNQTPVMLFLHPRYLHSWKGISKESFELVKSIEIIKEQ